MKFRQLEAFRHVILTGTTREAASRMFVSQPAISRLINALEEEVGFTLFKRLKGRLQPRRAPAEQVRISWLTILKSKKFLLFYPCLR